MKRAFAKRGAVPAGIVLLLTLAGAAAAQPDVLLEKLTNGQDADSPPGPILLVGSPVTWTYVVTSAGGRSLADVEVTDDQGVLVSCPSTTVPAGESMTCTAAGTVQAGQYANVGTVTATAGGNEVSASDPSHYFGQAAHSLTLEKATNGIDADVAPGPIVPAGSAIDWTYVVTNAGTDELANVAVSDDQGVVVSCPATVLAAGASMTCTGSGTAQPGQYANTGTAGAEIPDAGMVFASDPSHYFGQVLALEKTTNGEDADLPPGPSVLAGAAITWTYVVTNPGPAAVTAIGVSDDQGVAVSCPASALAAGASMTCTASGTAQPGQYANVGTATALLPGGGQLSASDPSHYFGRVLSLEKATNGEDADLPPGPVLAPGAAVTWTYVVANHGSDLVTAVSVTDDQGVVVLCPGTTLAAGASMTCMGIGTAQAGPYANVGTVAAMHPVLGEVAANDPSHYFGQERDLDFGDAPDPTFPTRFAAAGARHVLGSGVYLGSCVDAEVDGQPAVGADGDDTAAGAATEGVCAVAGDDEDGVAFTTALAAGTIAGADVVASAPCTLSAWIDWNRDGDWADAGEALFSGGTALGAGVNSLSFAVPASAATGPSYARFRCTTDGAVPVAGEATDGEVEDYRVALGAPAVTAAKTAVLLVDGNGDGRAGAGDTLLYTVVLGNAGTVDALDVAFSDALDAHTALVAGSVTTTQGTVTTGNDPGDVAVAVDAGILAGSATITYQATIDDPLPAGVRQVVNQGVAAGSNFGDVPTDDPGAPGAADATVVEVAARSVLEIPTASGWSLLALALLLAVLGMHRILAAPPGGA